MLFSYLVLFVPPFTKSTKMPTRPILLIMASIWRLKLETVRELFRMGEVLEKKDQQFLIQKVLDYICRTDPTFTIKKLWGTEKETVSSEEKRNLDFGGSILESINSYS